MGRGRSSWSVRASLGFFAVLLPACSFFAPGDDELLGHPRVPATGSGSGGGAGGSGGSGSGPCNKMTLVADDFDGTQIDPRWEKNENGGQLVASGGTLTMTAPAPGTHAILHSVHYYDLTDSQMSVRIETDLDDGEEAFLTADYNVDVSSWVSMHLTGTLLEALRSKAGVREALASTTYDPQKHAIWRIRESAGTLYWETSDDGVTFSELASVAVVDTFPLDSMTVTLGAWNDGTAGAAVVVADDFNGGTPSGVYCPIAVLTDDFEDGVRGPIWARGEEQGGGRASESGGTLQLEPPAAPGTGFGSYLSASAYDMTSGAIAVEAVSQPNPASTAAMTMAAESARGDGDAFDLVLSGGTLACSRRIAGSSEPPFATLPFDAGEHRFWRLREASGKVLCETSADAKAWSTRGQAAAFFDLSAVDVLLEGGTSEAEADPGKAGFDNFNLVP